MKIAVIFPSRGLAFSKTAMELLNNLSGYAHEIFFSHGLPIPDCFEKPLTKALKGDFSHIWFVEDDMILPRKTLRKMLDLDKAVVTADYPTVKNGAGAVFRVKDRIVFAGTGCTLVKREVFDELEAPYFTTKYCWNIKNYGDFFKLTKLERGGIDGYGLHDVNFFINIYKRNIPVHEIEPLGQRKLVKLGEAGSNNGAHQVEEWWKIKKDDLLEKAKKWPIEPRGSLVEIATDSGNLMAKEDHAEKLIKKGLAVKTPQKAVVIDG